MNSLVKLARPKHYFKNILLFAPFILSLQYSNDAFFRLLIGFVAFSFIASFGYIMNDVLDIESDRLHQVKRHRPLAAGEVSVKLGLGTAIVLLIIGISLGFYVSLNFGLVLLVYLVLNTLYSIYLKTVKWVDVAILSSFHVIRLFAGSLASFSEISDWFLLTSIFVFLMMSIDKRYAELSHIENQRRSYRKSDREILISLRSSLLVAVIICLNLYLKDLGGFSFLKFIMTLLTFIQLSSYLEKDLEDQVSKVLSMKFLLILVLMIFLYALIKLKIDLI